MKASEEGELDRETIEEYTLRMKQLKQEERQIKTERADDDQIRREWGKAQRELEKLHRKCAIMRERLKDPTYLPDHKDKRDIIEFFGITAIIWEKGHKPRIQIQAKFGDIVLQSLQRLNM